MIMIPDISKYVSQDKHNTTRQFSCYQHMFTSKRENIVLLSLKPLATSSSIIVLSNYEWIMQLIFIYIECLSIYPLHESPWNQSCKHLCMYNLAIFVSSINVLLCVFNMSKMQCVFWCCCHILMISSGSVYAEVRERRSNLFKYGNN